MTGWHRYLWRPVTLLCLLAAQLRPASLHQCGKYSYSVAGKCCQYCKPGFEMASRCTDKEDTQCKPCAKRLFNEGFSNDFCQPCTQCNVECSRCPPGHFSLGENTMCKLWTNCTAIGKRTLRAGSPRADADCEDARTPGPPRSPPTSAWTTTTSSSSTVHLRVTTQSLGVLSTLQSLPDKPWSPFAVIFLVLLLLLVFGLVMLVFGIYLSKRDKRQLPAIWKPPGTHSFRMPIQEEHQSSLAKV
ncbi:tumor necrosis factor receptor superfamily member 4 isoform X2 [Vombatus ursinus]|uniref:tumor necrosis factor receptor superfamily member 4 isoform X2 n=1 Tax=Vombatus ursinus TaxID=29139 RepID=UPI000FFD7997|nr:tumor necrosis factor receptor superfamily member 4 isoform X2 [Vombatus ursinus]